MAFCQNIYSASDNRIRHLENGLIQIVFSCTEELCFSAEADVIKSLMYSLENKDLP